ncbi:MAG: TolC family protein, partial [Flavobacteriales bacterium]|nr:TolC family protein [Flavobacteriales bacterium]
MSLLAFSVAGYAQVDTLPAVATLEQCVDYAVKNNISVNQSIISKNSAVVDRREAWGNFLPYVGASGSYSNNQGFSFDSNTNQRVTSTQQGMSVGLSAQLNLFNGLKDINSYRRAQLSLAAAEYSNEKIINDISLNVVNSYLAILAALEYEKVTISQYELSQLQVERIEKLVKAGSKAQGDLFEVQATLARDEQSMVDAKNQVVLAYLTLKQLLALDISQPLSIVTSGYDTVSHSAVLNSTPLEIYRSAEMSLPEIQKAKTDVEVSKRALAIAKGQFSPTLSASYGWNNSFIFDYKNPATSDPISVGDQWRNNSRQSMGMSLSIPIFNRMSTI